MESEEVASLGIGMGVGVLLGMIIAVVLMAFQHMENEAKPVLVMIQEAQPEPGRVVEMTIADAFRNAENGWQVVLIGEGK